MKTKFQALRFLSQYRPKSPVDGSMISSFARSELGAAPSDRLFSSDPYAPEIGSGQFAAWIAEGWGCYSAAVLEGEPVLLGRTGLEDSQVVYGIEGGERSASVPNSSLSPACDSQRDALFAALFRAGLRPSLWEGEWGLEPAWVPSDGERAVFCPFDRSSEGVGVVRKAGGDGAVEFYCCLVLPAGDSKGRLGMSMRERGIASLRGFAFYPAGESTPRSPLGNTVSCLRRLQRELEKEGKVWKDRMRRLEPIGYERPEGGRYWYVDDKMRVCQAVDEGTPVPRKRYLCGNYFPDHRSAAAMAGKFSEMLKGFLASEKWPEVD